jgi:hypothetical protein
MRLGVRRSRALSVIIVNLGYAPYNVCIFFF